MFVLWTGCSGDPDGCPEGTRPEGDGCVRGEAVAPSDGGEPACDSSACSADSGAALEGVFVSLTGDDTAPGSANAPFRTVAHAIAAAAGRPIYVAPGMYDETIDVEVKVIRIRGGWLPDGGAGETVVRVSHEGVRIRGLDGQSSMHGLDIVSEDAPGRDGSSSIALRLDGSGTVDFEDVRIVAGSGGAGAHGADGGSDPNRNGRDGSPGRECVRVSGVCDPGAPVPRVSGAIGRTCAPNGGSGSGGGSAQPGGASAAGRAGGVVNNELTPIEGLPREDGEKGRFGYRGDDGEPAEEALAFDLDGFHPRRSAHGQDGTAGEGGGGGGGGANRYSYTTCTPVVTSDANPRGASGGSGGSGGCGGPGGEGGQGGGASVAVLAKGVRLRFVHSELRTGPGGLGGDGGQGGAGGTGGRGGDGGGSYCIRRQSNSSTLVTYAGGRGGRGGDGGDGGHGAGGAGGPSLGIVLLEGADVETSLPTFVLGPAGVGGSSDGFRGLPGRRDFVWQSFGEE